VTAAEIDLAVVGAGPAGCAAAVQAARLGLSVALMDRTGRAGGLVANAWRMENYPGLEGPVSGPEYVRRLELMLQRFCLEVQRREIRSLLRTGSAIALEGSDGSGMRARAAVLATGSMPLRAGFRGEDRTPPVYSTVRQLDGMTPGRALVVGGGEAALDYSLSLEAAGWRVAVLVRSDRPRAGGRLLGAVDSRKEIRIHCGVRLLSVEGEAGGAAALLHSDEGDRVTHADAVLVAVGRRRELPDLPSGARVEGAGPVSGLPGAFCVGDAAAGSLGQACTAAGQGLEAAGMALEYLEQVSFGDGGGEHA